MRPSSSNPTFQTRWNGCRLPVIVRSCVRFRRNRTGRPVRLRLNRTQDLTMSGKRHGFHSSWTVGFSEDGRLVALDA
ncbi:MAG TPA: molybdopterin cofactor-binding domain-containing protein, partial [Agromyces sp.]